jgi:hypothetical protein
VGLSRREGGNGLSQAWQNEELTEDAEPEWQTRIFEGCVAGRRLRPWLQELWLYCGCMFTLQIILRKILHLFGVVATRGAAIA